MQIRGDARVDGCGCRGDQPGARPDGGLRTAGSCYARTRRVAAQEPHTEAHRVLAS